MSRSHILLALALAACEPAHAQCPDFNPERNPYVGDLHVHTSYSFDAVLFGITAGPLDAYEFAKGAPVSLPPFDLGRTAQLRRPLDFAAVTDHAEFFGETQVCTVPGNPGYDSQLCMDYRDLVASNHDSSTINPGNGVAVFLNFALPLINPMPNRNPNICGPGGGDCPPEANLVWDDIQSAAEEKNAPCAFTTFQAYEWTANTSPQAPPLGAGLHRNVIFRNNSTPSVATSFFEAPQVEQLWDTLATDCLDGTPGCDVMTIPHNSNFSSGLMWAPINSDDGTPLSEADAALRVSMERVAEIHQAKGSSECKLGVLTTDELCEFESLDRIGPLDPPDPNASFPPLSYVRNAFKEGLVQDEALGTNPFQMGVIGSTDAHNADPGFTNEADYGVVGQQGAGDWSAERILALPTGVGGIETNAGGLAIVWAEENTRDAIFDAIRRREVYATSGTRPIIRSFGGNLPDDLCNSSDFAGEGYRGGVPMGGEIGAVRGRKSPRFAVHATQDPGSAGTPGTPLERIQIVKGWVDDTGQSQERVFDVTVASGAGIDPTTCMPTGTGGAAELCAVWTDPDFDRSERAFYYARVLENPTCRWSRQLCNQLGVDCSDPGSVPAEFALCCSEDYPDTIQERAWTSPIWYRPEALGTVRGVVRFGPIAGKDVLVLKAQAERLPPDVDPATQDLTLELADDDVIYTVTLPAGSLTRKGSKFLYRDSTGANASLRRLTIKLDRGRFRLRARTIRTDLSNADRSDHEVEVRLTIGDHALTHRRVWHLAGSNLQVR